MRIDGLVPGQAINLTELAGILEKANIGDVVRAQILEITSSDLMLKLFDGSTVRAKTPAGIDGKVGEFMDFRVQNKEGNQVVLESVKNPGVKMTAATAENEIKNQLVSMGLKPDAKNTEILSQMKANQLPLQRALFDQITETLTKFKDLTPAKAAFLLSGNLNIEEKNIQALSQLVDGKAKITAQLDALFKTLTDTGDAQVLKDLENLLQKTVQTAGKAPVEGQNGINMPKKDMPTPAQTQINSEIKQNTQALTSLFQDSLKQADGNNVKLPVPIQTLTGAFSEFLKSNDLSGDMPGKFMAFLSKQAGGLDQLPPQQQNILKQAVEQAFKILGKELPQRFEAGEIGRPQGAQDPMEKSKANIEKAFHQLFVDTQSDNLKDDLNVKHLYKDIYTKLEAMKDTIQQSQLPNRHEIVQQMDNIQNNMRFMNDLSSHNSFIQIPLQIWDRNTTGELYVLKRDGKKKKIDPENVTVFLSLNTDNLGQVDSLVGMNKKNVTLNFRVEDENIIAFIKENYKELYNRLQEKGFKLVDMKYRIIEEEANVMNIKEVVSNETSKGKTSIDYRL